MYDQLFAINGVWLYPPDVYQEEPVPVVAYTTHGKPIPQGKPAITFAWRMLKQQTMSALMAAYQPATPEVSLTYIDKSDGHLVTATAVMEEPLVAARPASLFGNVSVKFTHIRLQPQGRGYFAGQASLSVEALIV